MAGRKDVGSPACPYALGKSGAAWWAWAWGTPQAAKWDAGALYTVGRRALLEDEWAAGSSVSLSREMRELEAELGLAAWAQADPVGGEEKGDRLDELNARRAKRRGMPAAANQSRP